MSPFGKQNAVGSSLVSSPVGFRLNNASPPGLNEEKFFESYTRTLEVSVSLGPTL